MSPTLDINDYLMMIAKAINASTTNKIAILKGLYLYFETFSTMVNFDIPKEELKSLRYRLLVCPKDGQQLICYMLKQYLPVIPNGMAILYVRCDGYVLAPHLRCDMNVQ